MNIRKRTFLALSAALVASTSMGTLALAQDGSVVIYTAHKSSIVDTLLPIFEQETGLKAEVVKLGSGDIAKRVQAEAGAPASACTRLAMSPEPSLTTSALRPVSCSKIGSSVSTIDDLCAV